MKKLKILTVLLTVVLVTMVAFFGVYVFTQNRMENKVKDYSYMMDLKGGRNIILSVDSSNKTTVKDSEGKEVEDADNLTDEEMKEKGYIKEEMPYNSEEALNIENYNKSKNVIEKRLKELKVEEYNIRVNEETGDIVIEIPENDNTDTIVSQLSAVGKFKIVDSNTKEILMDTNDLKLVNVMYGSDNKSATSSGTTVYLNIEFTEEGTKKLEEITNKYKGDTDSSQDNSEETEHSHDENEENASKVTLLVDDNEILSTGFEEPIKTGKMQLSIGKSSTDTKTIKDYTSQASNMAVVLNNGEMPVKYTVHDNQYVLSDITNNELNVVFYVVLGITCVALILLIFKYKMYGLLGTISFVGLASLLLLVIRYTNVNLSIQGILGIIVTLVLNYIFICKSLSKLNSDQYKKSTIGEVIKDTYKEFFIKIIPICIAIIVFCFAGWAPISSFGMVTFWGIVLIAVYNLIITNLLFRIQNNK